MEYVLDRLLAPLARLLVAWGLLYPAVVARLKRHYMTAARDAAERSSTGKVTDSRISVLTGLQRRDIANLKDQPDLPRPAHDNLPARLLAQWQVRDGYVANGKPHTLPRKGPGPSFDALAMDLRRDVHPRTLLDTLVAAGCVQLEDGDRVRLTQKAYRPVPGSDEQWAYLGDNIGDHLTAAVENVLSATPEFFERAVHYNGLTDGDVAKLDAFFREQQMATLQEVNRMAAELQSKARGDGRFRIRAGGYFYSTEQGET